MMYEVLKCIIEIVGYVTQLVLQLIYLPKNYCNIYTTDTQKSVRLNYPNQFKSYTLKDKYLYLCIFNYFFKKLHYIFCRPYY